MSRLLATEEMASSEATSSLEKEDAIVVPSPPIVRDPVKGRVVTIACRLQPEGDFVPEPLIDGIVLHKDDPTVDLHFVLHWGEWRALLFLFEKMIGSSCLASHAESVCRENRFVGKKETTFLVYMTWWPK